MRVKRRGKVRKKSLSLKKETVLRLVPEEDLRGARGGRGWASDTCCCWQSLPDDGP